MRIIVLLLFIHSLSTFAQEMGPRKSWQMIGSVLKVSEQQDTLLFNKGYEDGVAKGDHAWFWTHEQKGFRAECIQISESRSIWQIYRIETEGLLKIDTAFLVRQATKPIFVPSPEESDRL